MKTTTPVYQRSALATLISLALISSAHAAKTIEEVVVTAQKRSESIQDVPISITALSGQQIEQMSLATPVEVFSQTPNVTAQLPTAGTGFPIFNIRGITLVDFTDTNEASVASYVDEIYLGSPSIQNGQLFDIERVEILRGPQGTLYGRNATGGLVNFHTRKPTDVREGYISLGYGSYDDTTVEAALSGPLSDSVRGRIAVFSNTRDGWQDNKITGGDFGDVDENIALRGTLVADINDQLTVTTNLHYGNYEGEPDQRAFFGKGELDGSGLCNISAIFASQCMDYSTGHFDPSPDPETVFSDLEKSPVENENYGGWVRFDWETGVGMLTSITSYDDVDKLQILDLDNSPAPLYELYFTVEHEQWSQELRLSGEADGVNWVAGMYVYQDSRLFTVGFPQLGGYGTYADQDVETTAAFAQATWAVTDTVNITLGARYTNDKRDLNNIATGIFSAPGSTDGTPFFEVSRSLDESRATWRLAADWHLHEQHMVYGSVSTGFKSGAFNALYPATAANVTAAEPEDITTYELGIKGSLDSVPLSYNLALFYNDYENVQAQGSLVVDGTPQSALDTVADAKIAGAEFEITAMPADGLSMSLGIGYLDAEYEADSEATFNGVLIDGNRPVMTPDLNVNGSIRYEYVTGNGNIYHIMSDFYWTDDVYFGPDNLPTEVQDSYGIINLHAGWMSPGEVWSVNTFVKNVSDKEYFTHAVDPAALAPNQVSFTWGMPRTWGVKVRRSF